MLLSQMKDFSYEVLNDTVLKQSYLDKSFQVGIFKSKEKTIDVVGIDSRWDNTMRQSFIKSVATGNAVTPLVIVDAKECLNNADTQKDQEYFQSIIDKGFRYIVVDGWNRVVALLKFKNNLFQFPKTRKMFVLDNNNNEQFVEVTQPVSYSTLKESVTKNEINLVNAIDNAKIYVIMVTKASKKDISNLFLRVNDGKTLNGQEKRNGMLNVVADTIKVLSDQNIEYMSKLFSDTEITRLKFDDFIANCLLGYSYKNEKNISDTAKNKMYADESDDNPAVKFLHKFSKDFTDFCKFINESNTDKINSKTFLFYDYFMLTKLLEDKNIVIKDRKLFYQWYKGFVIKNIQSKKTYDIDDDVYTFDRMLRKNNANIIQYRMNMYVNDIYANLLNTDVINEYTPRSDSYQKYRYELWAKQNGFDAVSGESISLHEILDEKYHVDHIVPLSKQGSNDISNLRLVSREFNLKKSNKLDEELDMQFSA
jgi:hypothetical protein|tara:strand:+ start:578 stop:2017 length:1440 start_codon:yes stop_codon:yes gene_type:complete